MNGDWALELLNVAFLEFRLLARPTTTDDVPTVRE